MQDKLIAVVYETYDYGKFRRLKENRSLTESRLDKLVASFSEHEIMNPIIINEKFEIIDGQGRFDAKRKLGKPIYYVIDKDATVEDCRRMNTYNTPWSDYNYVESFANSGNENYIRFKNTIDSLKLPISRALRFSNKGTRGKDGTVSFIRHGLLIFDEKSEEMVHRVKRCADEISEALGYTTRPNDAFYTSVKVMTDTEGYNHAYMIMNCKRYRNSYIQASGLENELKELSKIYNYRRSSNNRIFFEDYMRNRGSKVRSYEDFYPLDRNRRGGDVSTLCNE